MKTYAPLALGLLLTASLALAAGPGAKPVLKDTKDKVSYSIGLNIGRDFKAQGLDVNPQLLAQGLADALSDAQPLLTDDQMREVMESFQQEMAAKMNDRVKEAATKNLKEGDAFLAANKKKQGVVTTKSGLQYKILKAGNGKMPKPTDMVSAHYRGTLIDGTEFDSSIGGKPLSIGVSQVIPGWTEALQLMPVGSKWQLFIPAKLAYGQPGRGGIIGPNATLIFDIELLGIEPPAAE